MPETTLAKYLISVLKSSFYHEQEEHIGAGLSALPGTWDFKALVLELPKELQFLFLRIFQLQISDCWQECGSRGPSSAQRGQWEALALDGLSVPHTCWGLLHNGHTD